MIPWRFAVLAPASSLSFLGALLLSMQSPGQVQVSLGEVIGGVLLMLSTYLFTASIRQGKEITKLQAQEIHNADSIAILQGEAATIDRRIADSRHAIRNELGAMLGEMELRLDARMKEFREGQEKLLALMVERRGERRKTDTEGL